jgi:hypothetical protein
VRPSGLNTGAIAVWPAGIRAKTSLRAVSMTHTVLSGAAHATKSVRPSGVSARPSGASDTEIRPEIVRALRSKITICAAVAQAM